MQIIILAAGASKRFQDQGYVTPKPFLQIEWRGTTQTMLEHVINTIPVQYTDIFVVTPKHVELPTFNRKVWSEQIEPTKGPAHTAWLLMKSLIGDSTLILDSDVLNFTNDLYALTLLSSMGVLVKPSSNPAYSYVDKLGDFTRIQEKEMISKYAVQGAYFIHWRHYEEFVGHSKDVIEEMSEPFISHVFNRMDIGARIAIQTTYNPVEWGTPRDVVISGAKIVTEKGK
jgi:NDP-sugar pyrophosphorylase family protein